MHGSARSYATRTVTRAACGALVVLAGCGRLGFDSFAGGGGPADAAQPGGDAAIDSSAAGCPSGYAPIVGVGGCYRLAAGGAAWLTAEQQCEADAHGAHLVVIDKATERDAVASLVPGNAVWIGTSRRTVATYRTVTNLAPYLALGTQTEPSEDCLSLQSDALMYLHTCTDLDRFVCEFDGIAAVPTAY